MFKDMPTVCHIRILAERKKTEIHSGKPEVNVCVINT